MPIPLNSITLKKLILIKQIYQRAVVQSASEHSDVDRILALISFDLANETLLKNAIPAVDSNAKFESDLGKLINKTNEVFTLAVPPIPQVPDTHNIRQVRKVRNSAMHDAIYPTANEISDCRTYTRDFLKQLVMNVWGEDFETIRLSDLIRHPAIKEFLSKSEIELEKGKYNDAAVQAKAGFNMALAKIQSSIVGSTMFSTDVSSEIWSAFTSIKDVLIIPIIGLDYASYIQYKRLTGHVWINTYADGGISTNIIGPERGADETTFIVSYVVNSVIQIESLVGDIEKPFGYENFLW